MTIESRYVKIADRVSTRLKLKQLRLLVAIAEHKSILHAARELNISQPAATKLIKDLETDFGVRLFNRTNRGVVPTLFGEALVKHGKLILSQISHAAQELDDLNEGTGGRVLVGTLLAASAKLLPQAIRRIHAQRPNITVSVKEGTNDVLMPALRNGDLDFVVGRLPEYRHRKEVVQVRLLNEKIRVVARAGHPLIDETVLSLKELANQEWILPPTDTTLRRQIDKVFMDLNLAPPKAVVESVSYLTNRQLLIDTDLIGIFPFQVVEKDIDAGTHRIIPCDPDLNLGPVGVSYRRKAALSPAAEAFLEILKTTAEGQDANRD